MFLLVSVRHVAAHSDGHQHGVSIQFINLGKTFLPISRIWNVPLTRILARVFACLPPFISQILDFICWTVLSFINLFYMAWHWKPAITFLSRATFLLKSWYFSTFPFAVLTIRVAPWGTTMTIIWHHPCFLSKNTRARYVDDVQCRDHHHHHHHDYYYYFLCFFLYFVLLRGITESSPNRLSWPPSSSK